MNLSTFHEQLKGAIDIRNEIAARIAVKPKGRDAMALCPFHADRNPSLSISTSKQIYKCFACGNGGDVIKFVMEYDKIPYKDAVKKLAQKYNIPLPSNFKTSSQSYVDPHKKVKALNELAKKFYHSYLLKGRHGEKARQYLRSRGFSKSAITTFQIGYAAPKTSYAASFAAFIKNDGSYGQETLLKSGLFRQDQNQANNYGNNNLQNSGNVLQDFFYNRIIFPIVNEKKETLAFAGRTIGSGLPKYLNSRDSEWFKKSEVLYGLCENLQQVSKAPLHIVEGYSDVIAAKMQGAIAVAGMGTSLTMQQIKKILRYTRETPVRIMFDNDAAGKKASLSAIIKLLEVGANAHITSMPSGQDPFDFLASIPPGEVQSTLKKNTTDVFTFLINHYKPPTNASPFTKKEALKNILTYFREVENSIVRAEFAQSIEKAFGHPAEKSLQLLKNEMPPRFSSSLQKQTPSFNTTGTHTISTQKTATPETLPRAETPQEKFTREIQLNNKERSFVFFLCHFPQYISNANAVVTLENISDPVAKYIYQHLLLLRGKENVTTIHILEIIENKEVHNIIIEELEKNKQKYEIKDNLQLLSRLTQLKINYAQQKQQKILQYIAEMENSEPSFTFNSETYKKIQNEAHRIVLEIEKLKQYIGSSQLAPPHTQS